jgi:hypothetical protein
VKERSFEDSRWLIKVIDFLLKEAKADQSEDQERKD